MENNFSFENRAVSLLKKVIKGKPLMVDGHKLEFILENDEGEFVGQLCKKMHSPKNEVYFMKVDISLSCFLKIAFDYTLEDAVRDFDIRPKRKLRKEIL